jgi:hypothetical protein
MRYLILFIMLTGCISAEQRLAERDALEEKECLELGFKPNTEGFATCRLNIRSIKAQEEGAMASKYGAIQMMQQNMRYHQTMR